MAEYFRLSITMLSYGNPTMHIDYGIGVFVKQIL